jgi:hypothetical protein
MPRRTRDFRTELHGYSVANAPQTRLAPSASVRVRTAACALGEAHVTRRAFGARGLAIETLTNEIACETMSPVRTPRREGMRSRRHHRKVAMVATC